VLCAVSDGAVNVSKSGWTWGNPTPQGRTLRAISFASGVGYAVGSGGTVLSTSNAGASWSGLTTGTSGEIERLQVLSPSTVIVGGGAGCITRISGDGGQTFTRIFNVAESGCPEPVAAFSFLSPQVGFLLLANGSVEATGDGGQTFARRTGIPGTPVSSGGGVDAGVALHFSDANSGIAIVNDPGGISSAFHTPDGGVSWTAVALPAGSRITTLHFIDPLDAYAIGPNTLLRTTDGGATWSARPIASGNSFNSIDCVDPLHCVLTVTAGNELVITSDGGATDTVKTTSSSLIYGAAYASPTQIVAVGAGGATVVSSDGGNTFASLSGDIGGEYGRLRAGPGGLLFAPGAKGDFAMSTDGGQSWHVLATQTSQMLLDVAFATPQLGYALDAAGGLQQTGNAGASWQTLNPGTTAPARAVAAVGGDVLLIGPVGVHRAVSGGRFEPVSGKPVANARLSDYDLAGTTVFAFGAGAGTLIRSTDGGARWSAVRLPLTDRHGHSRERIRSVAFTNATRGMLLDAAGRTWVTANAGASWRELLATGTSDGLQLAFSDATHGYMTLRSFGSGDGNAYVLRTNDGGASWHPQAVTLGAIGEDGLVATSAQNAALLIDGSGPGGASLPRLLFATSTGGDLGGPHQSITLSTPSRRLRRVALRRAHGSIVVDGTLTGALGGEQIVVSRRSLSGGGWQHQLVIAGANGGSFTTTWHIGGSSVFVAQWAGDSGRPGLASGALGVNVR
jgi:photosystem II stability/assembly factor-like uncharacterized protein